MQPVELTPRDSLLLKLLDRIDKYRNDYDRAIADDQHRKAAEFLKQIKRLVSMVDQLEQAAEKEFQLDRMPRIERSTSTKK